MKTKTAMQELIDKLEITNQDYYKKWKAAHAPEKKVYNDAMSCLTVVIMTAKKMLPKEKQTIIDAWDEGANGAMDTKTATDYYTQKYNQ